MASVSLFCQADVSDTKVIYRRYASLFFITSITPGENELITLEVIHRYVEVLDRYFGNVSSPRVKKELTPKVCELDLIFNFQKAYAILDELLIAGELQESSKKAVLKNVAQSDAIEEGECHGVFHTLTKQRRSRKIP